MKFVNMFFRILFLCFTIIQLSSCGKGDNLSISELNGEYTGTFSAENIDGSIYKGSALVVFNGSDYISEIGEKAGGNGHYSMSNDKIVFNGVTQPYTQDFDTNLILAGEYLLEISPIQIMFSSYRNGFGTYTYRLDRNN